MRWVAWLPALLACLPPPPCPTLSSVNIRRLHSPLGLATGLLLAGLLLWAVAAWPLPRIFSEAIPCTNLRTGAQAVLPPVPGDHLQLLYHFWLGLDAAAGHSPFFHNVYEFNLGDDSARLQPDLYYLPFSLPYAALAPLAGHAAGWNAAGLASALCGVLFLGLLVRRFTSSTPAFWLATLLAAAFPYRWITLFTGSPTGFAIALPPLLFYGLDRAIRDRSAWGGFLAGLAIFCAYTADLHTFYFSALAAPPFALVSFWMSEPSPRRWPVALRSLLLPVLPFALLLATAVAVSAMMSRHLSESVMASGRSLAEMASYSPHASGLVSTARTGMANHVYFGTPLFALLLLLLGLWILPLLRRGSADDCPPPSERIAVFAFTAALAVAILLALGIHGPFEGMPIRIIRKIVPKYTMIRQTVKIYTLLPALLAPLLGLLFARCLATARRSAFGRAAAALALALAAWTFLQSLAQTDPGFCRLPRANAAYAAVAHDATANAGRPPHALALPLWPGDSHWTSLCEYSIMLSRVRLVNGYAPAVPAGYFQDIFKKYESLNQGYATDEQLDGLLALGVRHLILHANAFPDKVSPFPASSTLRALTGHPRLALVGEDGLTFAFRILPKHPIEHTPHANWSETLHSTLRHWQWDPPLPIEHTLAAPLHLRAPVFPAPGLRVLLRLAPPSSQPLLAPLGREGLSSLTHPVAGLPDWLQAELPGSTGALVTAISGPVSLQHAILAAGDLPAPGPDASLFLPPALMFHLGRCSPGDASVTFDPETAPFGLVLFGPHLPVPPGVYDVVLDYTTPAAASPGIFRTLTWPGLTILAEAEVPPGSGSLRLPGLLLGADPVRFEFHYTVTGPVTLRAIRLVPSTIRLRAAAP